MSVMNPDGTDSFLITDDIQGTIYAIYPAH
jgi:hypothetical protein